MREEAVVRTGLKWRKIYKYLFDQGKRFKCNVNKSNDIEDFNSVPDEEFRNHKIFKIEKVMPGINQRSLKAISKKSDK